MKDTRIFEVAYSSGMVRYLTRIAVSGAASRSVFDPGSSYRKGRITRIRATNAEATAGWADVTAEFLEFHG